VLALSGTRAVVLVVNYVAMFRRYYWLIPVPSAVRWSCVKRLFSLGTKYLVTQLASLGLYQSQPLIITQTLGPSKVVIFVVAYKILSLPMDLTYMATQPFISAFGEAKARHDWVWIKRAYRHATNASLAFGLPTLAVMALLAKPAIRIWAGAVAVPSTSLVIALTIYCIFGIWLMAAGQFLIGVENVNPVAISLTLCAIAIIVLGVWWAPIWGLTGIAVAMAVSKVVTFWPIQVTAVNKMMRMEHAPVAEPVS
jgi:O-antigen/teichoic acid export membrane protein